jgi:hypothetical protein
MKRVVTPLLGLCLVTGPVVAQQAPAKPGPEHARIGFFAGTWQFEGEAKDSPMGPGGKLSGTDMCRWFDGGFQLVCQGDMTGPRGAGKSASVWAWDPAQSAYTYFGYNSLGDAFYVTGRVAGKVWTWDAEMPTGQGGTAKVRAVITEESPTAYSWTFSMSPDGTSWTELETGRATKRR